MYIYGPLNPKPLYQHPYGTLKALKEPYLGTWTPRGSLKLLS